MSERVIEISGLKFDPKIFRKGFESPAGPNSCTSRCCRHGVYLDPSERDRILAKADIVKKYFDETQTKDTAKWFDNSEEPDPDFPSGKCVSTDVFNDKCVFLDKMGRCSLQVTEKEEGFDRFSLKPYYCVLFPLAKVNGVFEYDDFCSGESPCCTASSEGGSPMVEICSVELEHALGKSKYGEVLEYFRSRISDPKSQGDSQTLRKDFVGTGK